MPDPLGRAAYSADPSNHDRLRDIALLVLRGSAGVTFAYHGWLKIDGGVSGFAGFVDILGVPFPDLTAWVVSLLELVGGIMLAVGLLSRVVGALFVLEMIGTTSLVKLDVGLIAPMGGGAGAEIDVALGAIGAAVALLGGGRLAVDHLIWGRRSPAPAAPSGPPPAPANVPAQPPPTGSGPGAEEGPD